MDKVVMTTKNVFAICGFIVLCSAAVSDSAAQESDNSMIKAVGVDKQISAAAITDKEIAKEAAHDISSSFIELKNGSLVPAWRLDGSAAEKGPTGAVIYGHGVYVERDGAVRHFGKVVRKLGAGESLSMSDIESLTGITAVLPSAPAGEAPSAAPQVGSNVPGSPKEYPTVSPSIARDPSLTSGAEVPAIPREQGQTQPVPVTTSGVPEAYLAGAYYQCPAQIQVTARIVPDSNSLRDNDVWNVSGDGLLSIVASELDVNGGIYFPTCYYVGSRGERSIFTTFQVDRDVYKMCSKRINRNSGSQHGFICSPDEDWLNKTGNDTLHNEELDLDYSPGNSRADIEYRTQNGQATLRPLNNARALAILRGGVPRRGTCSAALDNPVTAIPQSALNPGVVVCYQTSLGRYGYLKILGHVPGKPDSIAFNYRTFAKLDH